MLAGNRKSPQAPLCERGGKSTLPLEIDLGRGTLSIEKINFITLPNMGVIGFDGDQEVNEACRALGVS